MKRQISIGNEGFENLREKKCFYIDKTSFIKQWWESDDISTLITRPRRFGKTLNMDMLRCFFSNHYKDRGDLFEGLSIWKDEKYRKLQGTYPVIFLSFAEVKQPDYETAVQKIKRIIAKLYLKYPELLKGDVLTEYEKKQFQSVTPDMDDVTAQSSLQDLCDYLTRYYNQKVIILLDEYDTPMQEAYMGGYWNEFTSFIRSLFNSTFKTNPYLERAIMTGITRVSKESIFSDLNNLNVVTTTSEQYATCFGFTETEVFQALDDFGLSTEQQMVKQWYDGYMLEEYQIYNPKAVVSLMLRGKYKSYWSDTGTYEAIVPLINMDFDGLKTAIIEMLSGNSAEIDPTTFQNDMVNFTCRDDVLTCLIHLGYLGYDQDTHSAFVPNEEIRQELAKAVKRKKWNEFLTFQQEYSELLDATLDMDTDTVARSIEKIHNEYASAIQYNNENSLSSILSIGYLSTMRYYFKPIREFPAGRGFADFVYLPKPEYSRDYPALVVELKWNQNAQTAIRQIKNRQYPEAVANYTDNILLVGISYDKKQKTHNCVIEKYSEK